MSSYTVLSNMVGLNPISTIKLLSYDLFVEETYRSSDHLHGNRKF